MSLSASSTRRHAASLLPKHLHNPELLELIKGPLTPEIATHIAAKCVEVIDCRPDPALASPPTTPVRGSFGAAAHTQAPAKVADPCDPVPALAAFITLVCDKSHCHLPTLLVTLVYLERLRTRLPKTAKGTHSTRHRVFLATLIVAAKYCNDSSPMNAHWVRYAGATFNQAEVNLMERQLLAILDWDLDVQEPELVAHLAPFLAPLVPQPQPQPQSALRPARSSFYLNRAAAQANLRDITPNASRYAHSRQSSTDTGDAGRSLTAGRPPPVPSRSSARPTPLPRGLRHRASCASLSSPGSLAEPGSSYSASSSDDELASPEPASSPDAPVQVHGGQLAGSFSCSHLSPPPSPTRGLRKMLSRAHLGDNASRGGLVKSASYAGLSQSHDGRKPTALKRMFNKRDARETAPATVAGAHHWA